MWWSQYPQLQNLLKSTALEAARCMQLLVGQPLFVGMVRTQQTQKPLQWHPQPCTPLACHRSSRTSLGPLLPQVLPAAIPFRTHVPAASAAPGQPAYA